MKKILISAVALACAGALQAHHSGSMYATTPVRVAGTVVGFEDINPHTITMIEQRREDGTVRLWGVEGPGRSQLDRRSADLYIPAVGDTLEFCAFPYKSVEELTRLFPDADFSGRRTTAETNGSSPRYVAGHVMVTADREMRIWEPHGSLAACIQSANDSGERWIEFIDSNSGARDLWCEQSRYAYVQASTSLSEVVDEVGAAIAESCD